MLKAPFVTPQSLALRRAHSSVMENAYRFYAFTNAAWEKGLDIGFVEEEARESFVLLSVNFRRATEIFGLKKQDLPNIKVASKQSGLVEHINLAEIMHVGAHLQYFKVTHGGSTKSNDVGNVIVRSDNRGFHFKPADLVNACLSVLPTMTADAYEERSLHIANNQSTGAN